MKTQNKKGKHTHLFVIGTDNSNALMFLHKIKIQKGQKHTLLMIYMLYQGHQFSLISHSLGLQKLLIIKVYYNLPNCK